MIWDLEVFRFEMHAGLLEWSPTVICKAKHAELLINAEIKIDLVINDKTQNLEQLQNRCKFESFNASPNSIIEKLTAYLDKNQQRFLSIICSKEHRTLFTKNKTEALIKPIFYEQNRKSWLCKKHEKWYPGHVLLELEVIENGTNIKLDTGVSTKQAGERLTFETTKDGIWHFSSNKALLFAESF